MNRIQIASPRPRKRARIEIIPLIDIMFFLLATFVMVSLSMVKSKGIPVALPEAESGESQSRDQFTTVTITSKNEILIDKAPVTASKLAEAFEKLAAAHPDPKIFINGDESSALGTAITVFDALRIAGIKNVAFETKPKQR